MSARGPSDARGNPSGSRSADARGHAEQALWRMMSSYDDPLAEFDAAMSADPGWALPHVMKAGFLLGRAEPALLHEGAAHLSHARALAAGAPARERAPLDAVQQAAEGRWHAASRTWDDLLVEHPRDALALHWAQQCDLLRGDAAALRSRPARALPEWDDADPLHPHLLGLYAFGLEECNLHAQAEEAGRRALAADARVPWAVHAVAHVMEMQGRFEEGSAWLRQHQAQWAEGTLLAGHLWWHKALFRLEALDVAGVMRIVDAHLDGAALRGTLQRVDATALLWRLHLLGEDVAGQAAALLHDWDLPAEHAGHHAFFDVHAVMAMLAAGRAGCAERHVARCAERALAPQDARRANHQTAREVGLPLMRGLLAFARGQHAAACELIHPVRALAPRLGGSHVQRDVVDLTLLACAARGGPAALGRALLNERVMAKPVTPLTRRWVEALGGGVAARA
ncbi:MAG: tetratricopeptide repeat protein [Pseudomonadota bacterium]